jgi:hypothetical protein
MQGGFVGSETIGRLKVQGYRAVIGEQELRSLLRQLIQQALELLEVAQLAAGDLG